MKQVSLIGLNGKLTSEFSEKISHLKNDGIIDHNCYTGSAYDNLSEYAGRLCYRSGFSGSKNRPSEEYHKHIHEVGHHSIYGHNIVHIELSNKDYKDWCVGFAGIPGWYPHRTTSKNFIGVNFRLIENTNRNNLRVDSDSDSLEIFQSLYSSVRKKSPLIFPNPTSYQGDLKILNDKEIEEFGLEWYSFEIKTSRRVAQELTRHGFQSGISMESTRYVDISENTLIFHPYDSNHKEVKALPECDKQLYKAVFEDVYNSLLSKGFDKSYSKKQARGAAAAHLPLGLETNLIFSCSKQEFEEIKRQRISESADREIYELVGQMVECVNINTHE